MRRTGKQILGLMLGMSILAAQIPAVPAFALEDLKETENTGGLSDLIDNTEEGVLPDPSAAADIEGELYRDEYQIGESYICKAYRYEQTSDPTAFLEEYTALSEERGFQVSEGALEGYDALELVYGEYTAYLLPDFDGHMMLFVENGMEFEYEAASAESEMNDAEVTDSTDSTNSAAAAETAPSYTDWPVLMEDPAWYTNSSGGIQISPAVFDNSSIMREEIVSITFYNTLDVDKPVTAWDVSEAGDGTVMAWVEKNGSLYDLYIAGENGVKAPENCHGLFEDYTSVESIDFGGCFDTSETTSMLSMFKGCCELTSLDLSCFNTENVTMMRSMFYGCKKLEEVIGLDVPQGADLTNMFDSTNMY